MLFQYLVWFAAALAILSVPYFIYKFISQRNKTVVASECGHETKLKGEISVFGETSKVSLRKDTDYCINCLEDMVALCPWCEKPILIGSPITLYSPMIDDFEVPEDSVVYKEDPLTLVGCGRTSCADTGADYAGFWIPPGKVKRKQSLIEQSLADIENGGDGVVAGTH